MRHRLAALLLPCALLCSLLLPGPALATSSWSTTVERDTCVVGAGKYHFAQGVLRARITEYGKSGTTQFTWVAQVWHLPIHGTTWTKEYEWPHYVTSFTNDKSSHYESRQFAYSPDHNAYHKIVVRVSARSATGATLYTKLFQGKTC